MIISTADFVNMNTTGYLVRVDKHGDLLWKRIYPHPPTNPSLANYFFGFNTTADKGFIMTGQYNHLGQPYQNMWLVKTDSLGCDSVSCSYLPTGITKNTFSNDDFILYPNPAHSFITIESPYLNAETEIKIINMLGETMHQTKISPRQSTIDVSLLAIGVYFVELKSHSFTRCRKFVKQ